MTAHHAKIPPRVNYIRLHSRINRHTQTAAHAIIQNPVKRPAYTSSLLRLHTTIRTTCILSRQAFIIPFITNQAQKLLRLILSCPHISLSGKVVGNPLAVYKNIWTFGHVPYFPNLRAAI